ncbi:MAG: hypothetical protein IPK19_15235 [Chloroflexi bacterium]|nr:hypothetical protein [Chloroflexota bacterium]
MLNLQEVKNVIDHLSTEERRELLEHLKASATTSQAEHPLSTEERIRRMDEAAEAIRASFTDAEWAEVEMAMNMEVQPC